MPKLGKSTLLCTWPYSFQWSSLESFSIPEKVYLRQHAYIRRSGSVQGSRGVRSGSVWDPFELRAGSARGPCGIRSGSVRNPFEGRAGFVRDAFGIRNRRSRKKTAARGAPLPTADTVRFGFQVYSRTIIYLLLIVTTADAGGVVLGDRAPTGNFQCDLPTVSPNKSNGVS